MAEFTTVQEVKDRTQISGEADESLIAPFIITAQDKFLRVFLGEDFYQQLKAAIPSPSGAQATLINTYIKPYLAWFTLAEALPRIRSRVHNGGVFNRSSQDTSPIDQKAFDREMGWARETGERYGTIMADYLNDNTSTFPLWKSTCKSNQGSSSVIMIG